MAASWGVTWDDAGMSEPERSRVVYVTSDGTGQWLGIDVPFGMITPPTITIHRPLGGAVDFYYASCYKLPVPAAAADCGWASAD